MVSHNYKTFTLVYEPESGDVWTYYADGTNCKVWPNSEDEKHAAALGITPGAHKILHEIIHQQLALAMGEDTCPIVWAQAHQLPMLTEFDRLEEMIMALTYFSLRIPMPYPDWWQRIGWVQQFYNPFLLLQEIAALYYKFVEA